MLAAISVFIGSALGSIARFWLAARMTGGAGDRFPWGTLAVNASGALAAGAVLAWLWAPGGVAAPRAWDFGMTGFLGGYTTVSTFSLQTLALLHERKVDHAFRNVLASLLATLGGAGAGWYLVMAVRGVPA